MFIVAPSLEGWQTKAKEAHSPHEVRLAPLDTNPVFQSLGAVIKLSLSLYLLSCVVIISLTHILPA